MGYYFMKYRKKEPRCKIIRVNCCVIWIAVVIFAHKIRAPRDHASDHGRPEEQGDVCSILDCLHILLNLSFLIRNCCGFSTYLIFIQNSQYDFLWKLKKFIKTLKLVAVVVSFSVPTTDNFALLEMSLDVHASSDY